MSFIHEIVAEKRLRRAAVKAITVVATALFIIRLLSEYVTAYGPSLDPLLRGKVRFLALLGWATRDAALGALSGLVGVYVAWRQGRADGQSEGPK